MRQRICALLLAAALVLAQFAAEVSLSHLHDHDCSGADCAICHVLGLAKTLLGSASAAVGAVHRPVLVAVASVLPSALCGLARAAQTPVTLKVRLID